MKTLEQRFSRLFAPADLATARDLVPASVSCPRVGQVRGSVPAADGGTHEVQLELAAHRRGGMTLEARCTSPAGRAGRPCAALAAVLLEVDRRGLLAGIPDQTPVALDIVPDDVATDRLAAGADVEPEGSAPDDGPPAPTASGRRSRVEPAPVAADRRGGGRPPAWVAELEERRRLVEPAVRTAVLEIPDARRSAGALVFTLDLSASADARSVILVPCRMPCDVAGNATGRPRPVELGPGGVEFDELEPQERELVERLVGATPLDGPGTAEVPRHRTIARIAVGPRAAASHVAMLCETGRLVLQPEPRRSPDHVVPLAWDAGRPWEFAFVIEPDDDHVRPARTAAADDEPPPRPTKAVLRGMLVRGSQRKTLDEPRAILRAGLVVFTDRVARLAFPDGGGDVVGWIDQFERRGPIEIAGSQADGVVERLATLADLPRVVLPAWTGWRIESGVPQPKLVLDDSPAIDDDTDGPTGRRRTAPRVQLAGRIWFDYGGILVAADDPAGGVADSAHRVLARRDRAAERDALAILPRHGAAPFRAADADATAPHVQIPRSRLDASVAQLAAAGWTVEVAGRRYRPAGSVA